MISNKTIKIGTRGSKLALWQAEQTRKNLRAAFPDLTFETAIIKTKGDLILDVPLPAIGDKGLFTKEIENALLSGEIDLAVHSLKDLPTDLPDGLAIGGMLPRGEVRDILISREGRKLTEMTAGDRIATSSLRRKAQLLHFNPALTIIDIRGNIDTRIQKMKDGYCDALIMAGAGIIRLAYQDQITAFLDPSVILPAVSQGAVAIEIREDDETVMRLINAIADEDTWLTTMAERAFLRTLEGGCQVPVGCYCERNDDQLKITGILASLDGKELIKRSVNCLPEEASEKAIELAWEIIDHGGQTILQQIRSAE
jgi:hydroxymethylbilane synthase